VESYANAQEPFRPPQTQDRRQCGRSSVARRESVELCSGAGPASTLHETAPRPPGPGGPLEPVPPSHHGHDLARWPLRDAITLGALAGAVPSARVHVRQVLWEWGWAELGHDVGVVVSELVTNSVMASAELRPAVAPVLVWLGSDNRSVLAAVADMSPRPPARLDLGPEAEGGRGLALVEAFSSRWGWHPTNTAGLVKVIWAEWCRS
jgi:anti-sigma regulatory factor (Ser/Thr protein kinase)